jgi:hypothetical protein
MCCSVGTYQTRAVNGKSDRQALDGDVVYDLIVTAL